MTTATFTVTAYVGTGQLVNAVVYDNVISYSVNVAAKLLTLVFAGGEPTINFDLSNIGVFDVRVNEGSQDVNVNETYEDIVLADDPINYWRLDETSGADAEDIIDGLDGIISGGITLNQPGAVNDNNPSMLFDGNDGTIDMSPTVIAGPFTLECWFKFPSITDFAMPVSFSAPGDNDNWCQIYFTTDPPEVTTPGTYLTIDYAIGISTNNGYEYIDFTDFDVNTWYHVVIIFSFGELKAYINGVEYPFATQDPPFDFVPFTSMTQEFHIGSDDGEGFFWNGNVDEVAIYDYALEAEQVLRHYNAKRVS